MDLQESKQKIKAQLLDLVVKGSQLRDNIGNEYRTKRSNRTFDQKQDVANWTSQYGEWYQPLWTSMDIGYGDDDASGYRPDGRDQQGRARRELEKPRRIPAEPEMPPPERAE